MHILKEFITIDDLETRWGLNKKQIESFTYDRGDDGPRLTMWYATEKRPRPDGGQSAFVKYAHYLNGCIFDMADVLEIEELNPELVRTEKDQGDSEPKMIGDKFVFTERQLIKKEDLYKRWFGATHEEIARHFDAGELRAYEYYKGPINNVIWCNPGQIYYQDRHDYSASGLYEYHDDQCSYFLLADVMRCEAEHPEYTGNVTPESLGLVQDGMPESAKAPLPHAGLVTLSADEIINRLGITPIELVDILNGYEVPIDTDNFETKRLVTVDEEAFREYVSSGWNEKFFSVKALGDVKIYQVDFDRYCETWGIEKHVQPEGGDSSSLESQLAEAQKQIESLRQWNKRLNEQNEELRVELAAAQEIRPSVAEVTTTVDAAKWENSVKAVLEIWAEIVQGDKTDWKEDECRAALAQRYRNYHTKVHDLAWRALPDAFKHGRGRPKKNLAKSQQPDKS